MAPDWTTPEYLANISAEELKAALDVHGVRSPFCGGDEDGVTLHLADLKDAELMMSLAFTGPDGPGTLYDHAVGSCVTLSALSAAESAGAAVPEEAVADAFEQGWTWMMHPDMDGRRVSWHISVTIPTDDANQVTARLNELRNGRAL